MATPAAAAPAEADPAPGPARGKKKLLILIAGAVLLLLALGGGAAFWVVQRQAAEVAADPDAEAGSDAADVATEEPVAKPKGDKHRLPVFLPMEIFTVNLADRDAERYAQVGVTLEVADNKTSDLLKAYMPALRNDVLMLIAHKTAADLQDRAGKLELAREIKRAALKPLDDTADAGGDADEAPVRAVLFSSFIIQ
ncbi:MAG TPA: flagellar basal body-associated FliL family protein [Burkholderiaceae bacterium]|nr:flagellar basal body-associated FliL family protein [Burkholderiaceae bacterium]